MRSRYKANGGSYLSSHDMREVLGLGGAAKVELGRNQVAAAERPGRALHRRARSIATSPSSKAKAALTPEARSARPPAGARSPACSLHAGDADVSAAADADLQRHDVLPLRLRGDFGDDVRDGGGRAIVYLRPQRLRAGARRPRSWRARLGFRRGDRRQLPRAPLAPVSSRAVAGTASPASSLTYAVLSVPFIFSGIVVSLALTRFRAQVSALYARRSGRGGARVPAGRTAAAAHRCADGDPGDGGDRRVRGRAVCADRRSLPPEAGRHAERTRRWLPPSAGSVARCARARAGILVLFTVATPSPRAATPRGCGWSGSRGNYEARPLVEQWNSFSRIRVIGDPDETGAAVGLGVQHHAAAGADGARAAPRHRFYAGTELTAFHGDPAAVRT